MGKGCFHSKVLILFDKFDENNTKVFGFVPLFHARLIYINVVGSALKVTATLLLPNFS